MHANQNKIYGRKKIEEELADKKTRECYKNSMDSQFQSKNDIVAGATKSTTTDATSVKKKKRIIGKFGFHKREKERERERERAKKKDLSHKP